MAWKILRWIGVALLAVVVALAAFVGYEVYAFNASMATRYDIPLPDVTRSTDPVVVERGKHIVESYGACLGCHGGNLGGGKAEDFGPLGTVVYPNITTGQGGAGADYSDAEFARLLKHGVKRDGSPVQLMPSGDFAWWPMDDVTAVVSYVRTVPPVDGQPRRVSFGVLAKVLDRLDMLPIDVARRIDHANLPIAPPPAETKEYGERLASGCRGCHGETLSGGPIPGAPATLPVPLNLTPDATGLKDYSLDDFKAVLRTGIRKNGKTLDPFMPISDTKNLTDMELGALYAYFRSLPPKPFGSR